MIRRTMDRAAIAVTAEDLRVRAGEMIAATFDSGHKIVARVPGLYRERVSHAVNGSTSNPLFVLAGWMFALFIAGAPRERAQQMIDWLQDFLDSLYSATPRPVLELSREEQRIEGHETSCQVAYGGGDKTVRREWIADLRAERAVSDELIRALEAEELAEQLTYAEAA